MNDPFGERFGFVFTFPKELDETTLVRYDKYLANCATNNINVWFYTNHTLCDLGKLHLILLQTVLEFQFWSAKCTVVTKLRKNFEQLFIPIQAIQGDHSMLM